jgi:hypothetical protein
MRASNRIVLPLVPLVPLVLAIVLASGAAVARPTAPRALCAAVSADAGDDGGDVIAACQGTLPSCTLCHLGPPDLNLYGAEVFGALAQDDAYDFDNFESRILSAVAAVHGTDTDGDGVTNLEELALGTFPGDAASVFVAAVAPAGDENIFYAVGTADLRFAFRRVHTTFCGVPPTFEMVGAFNAKDDDAKQQALHDDLSACLQSDYWKNEALHRLADNRIRPLESISADGLIPLADYNWDYRLFSYIWSDDRDLRDLLLADYHVDERGVVVEGVIPIPPGSPLETGGQPLLPEQRAGMMTTQWFLMAHTMFSALPRTTAAQAYRAYLGMDIAKGEGIHPVDDEPTDVDAKGVTEPACVVCHSTLDPLSYAFSPYNGIGRLRAGGVSRLDLTGTFNETRVPWGPGGVFFGAPVTDLRSWAELAVASDAFKKNLGDMLWRLAFQRAPSPDERADFDALWRGLDDDAFSANRALHRLIDTPSFQVP